MPNILEEMGELKYLYLPRSIHDMVKMALGNLVKLETLKNFSTKHSSVTDLQGMTRLRVLSINSIEGQGCNMDTLSSSLSELRHLENLTISDKTLLASGLVLNYMNLKQLTLKIHMPKLPDEQHLSSNLTTIYLEKCRLEEDPLPILDKLPQLKEVRLWRNSFCGKRMVCSRGGFPQLQKLLFFKLKKWEEWIVEEGSMPLLQNLEICYCLKLKELPTPIRDFLLR
ncbi:probable disease resistance protein RF9 [Eutrema salsugineum]|uniref:probable disease resistance protein RF9 n=1 Tax=Eutrema salsugineum TaxID=72664 RepID=UPI000CED269C|nr:probable disease resistance protein RF9 [Eutrema salsugineum]